MTHILRSNFFCNVRDQLICILHITHGHCSGVSANHKIDDFNGAKLKRGDYIIKVGKHKTFSSQGYAIISPSGIHFSWFEKYLNYLRPSNLKTDNFFVPSNEEKK